eukprot:1158370-Pelagomonas_calceolata.AAC.11
MHRKLPGECLKKEPSNFDFKELANANFGQSVLSMLYKYYAYNIRHMEERCQGLEQFQPFLAHPVANSFFLSFKNPVDFGGQMDTMEKDLRPISSWVGKI